MLIFAETINLNVNDGPKKLKNVAKIAIIGHFLSDFDIFFLIACFFETNRMMTLSKPYLLRC